jgi:signal transduction histidine kinase
VRKITLVLGIAFLLQWSNQAIAAPFPLDSLRKQVESSAPWELKKDALLSLTDHYQMHNNDSLFYYTNMLRALGLEHDDAASLMHVSLVIGRSYNAKGEIIKARSHYYEALYLAKKHNLEKGIAWASLNLGLNHGRGFELDSAFYYVQEAEKFFIKTDLAEELWRCYLGFATINKERRDLAAADADFRKSIALYPDNAPSANRGFLLYRTFAYAAQFGRFDLLRDVRIMWDEYKGAKSFNISLLEKPEHIALYSLIAGEEIDMVKVIYDAIDYYKNSDRPYRLAWCYHDLGEIYYNDRNYTLAKEAYEKSDILYTQAGYSSHLGFIRKRLAELYQREGDYLKALDYTNASYRILDSLKNEESERNLRQFEVQYETEKKEQALIINQLELKQKTQERNIWLGSSVFLALLGLLIFGGLRQRLRQRELLSNQEAALQEQRIQQLEQEKTLLAMSSMIEGQEQERQRIAKDLHDGMGGLLTTIKAHYSTLVSYFPVEEATEKIAPLTGELIDRACTEVRRISQNMMPAALLYSGLSGALEDLAVQVRTNGMECTLEIVGPIDRIDEIRTIALYRVVQEAVNNILKHAKASHVLIQVIVHQAVVNATIEDDGLGFEIEEGLQKKSLGLKSMDSRVRYLKGSCDIDSVPGEGTTVLLQFPME